MATHLKVTGSPVSHRICPKSKIGRLGYVILPSNTEARRFTMKTLILYYSLSGTTRRVATQLAGDLDADIEEISCKRYLPGLWGYLLVAYDSIRGNLPPIGPLAHSVSKYELVVIAAPIWAFRPATPARTLLKDERERLPRVAFVLTHGGSAAQRSLDELQALLGRAPAATLVVREHDVKQGKIAAALSAFEAQLQQARAA
jgi:hypothetical protein